MAVVDKYNEGARTKIDPFGKKVSNIKVKFGLITEDDVLCSSFNPGNFASMTPSMLPS